MTLLIIFLSVCVVAMGVFVWVIIQIGRDNKEVDADEVE